MVWLILVWLWARSSAWEISDSQSNMFVFAGFAVAVRLWILIRTRCPILFIISCTSSFQSGRLLCLCFSLMDGHPLIQHFCHILSFASLAYTFTTLHTIQYSMQDHCNNNNTMAQTTEDHNSTNFSASSSTQDTPASVSTSENIEKTSGW